MRGIFPQQMNPINSEGKNDDVPPDKQAGEAPETEERRASSETGNASSRMHGEMRSVLDPNAASEPDGTAVRIETGTGRQAITLQLPARVAHALAQLFDERKLPSDAVSALRERLRRFEECVAEDENTPDIFSQIMHEKGGMALFSWTIDRYSDPGISDEERALLRRHILSFMNTLGTIYLTSGMFDAKEYPIESLECRWYLLVRLLARWNSLEEQEALPHAGQEHLRLMRDCVRFVVAACESPFRLGVVAVDPTAEIADRRLLDLLRKDKSPWLQKQVRELRGLWREWSFITTDLHQDCDLRSQKEDSFDLRSSQEILREGEARRELMEQLQTLQAAMIRASREADEAWQHPIGHITRLAATRNLIMYGTTGIRPEHGDPPGGHELLPNALRFHIELLREFAQAGFRQWAIGDARFYLTPLAEWLSAQGDRRSVPELASSLQQYLDAKGRNGPSIRSFLALPESKEPLAITQNLRFWQELAACKREVRSTIMLFPHFQKERNDRLNWLQGSPNEKKICICSSYEDIPAHSQSTLSIQHDYALPDYDSDTFASRKAIMHCAHQIGSRRGWGDFQSSALHMQGNEPLCAALKNGSHPDMPERISLPPHDIMVISSRSDDREEDAGAEPPEEAGSKSPELDPAGVLH